MKPVKILVLFVVAFSTVAAMPWVLVALYRAGGYGACIGVLVALYVGVHYLLEPYRPPWEPSLFGTRGSDAIRHRRWLNPDKEEQ